MGVRIVSGGQTGVDRAALDFALRHHLPHGGWCPRGRWAEDGPIPPGYALSETEAGEPGVRTERNVIDSDATLIFVRADELRGGTALTRQFAERHGRPVLVVVEREDLGAAAERVREFIGRSGAAVLNVAGPRESQAPGLANFVTAVLERALGPMR